MGWWEHDSALIGDDALDATYHFLMELRDLYSEDLDRRPTAEELAVLLTVCLQANASDKVFADFEERRVTAVTIKTAKRPKRQKYSVGDVFAIPLGAESYAFGRIMELSKQGDIVEIFQHTDTYPKFSPEVIESGRLFHPICVSGYELFADWQWQVLASDPEYVPDDLDSLRFVYGGPGDLKLVEGKKQRPISDDEAVGIERMSFWPHEAVVKRIQDALKDRGKAER
jgi:hypothetical protein